MIKNPSLNALFGLLKVSGPDAQKLLQGQLTCDVTTISTERSSLGALCNPQGRVISLFHLFFWQDAYYLFMPRQLIPITLKTLKKYALFYQATLVDASDDFVLIGYTGMPSASVSDYLTIAISATRHLLIMTPAVAAILDTHELSMNTVSAAQWHYLNIRDKLPLIYPETSGQFLPHELQLPALNAISFEKGCYTGQEIIARMHYRGRLKTQLYS
ncbi:MAG TPA: folate-binding protein YgfZ, partial [Gammaproteobacteria bacterium]|nr:folate-binding protein YgfZ [Gammaproteobacteria bacterium]